jgi:hypothetical protein
MRLWFRLCFPLFFVQPHFINFIREASSEKPGSKLQGILTDDFYPPDDFYPVDDLFPLDVFYLQG